MHTNRDKNMHIHIRIRYKRLKEKRKNKKKNITRNRQKTIIDKNLGVWEHDGGVKQGGRANPGRDGEPRGASPSRQRSQGDRRPKQRRFNTLRIEAALGRPSLCNALAGLQRRRRR